MAKKTQKVPFVSFASQKIRHFCFCMYQFLLTFRFTLGEVGQLD